jgi:chorismate mutase-like protein
MSEPLTLDQLREQIDTIDAAIHDLLMQRADVVQAIGRLKAERPVALHPGREAAILRRLVDRHRGPLPAAVVVRMWRELLAGMTGMQRPFSIAVVTDHGDGVLWDVARDHFGSTTPVTAVTTPIQAIRAVADGSAGIAVVPWPDSEERQPWWPMLMVEDAKTPRVVARLPFALTGDGDEGPVALAVGCLPHESTGDDLSLLCIELAEAVSRSRLKEAIETAGLSPSAYWTAVPVGDRRLVQLVEIAGFLDDADPRLDALLSGLDRPALGARVIGGFARPLRLDRGEDRR